MREGPVALAWCVLVAGAAAGCKGGGASPGADAAATGGLSGTPGGSAAGAGGLATGAAGASGAAGATPLPEVTVLPFFPRAVSSDSSVDGLMSVGEDFHDPSRVLRWTAAGGAVVLSDLSDVTVRALTFDGKTIVGESTSATGTTRVVLVTGGVRTTLPLPRGADTQAAFVGMIDDAHTVAGTAWSSVPVFTSSEAFRWTSSGGTEGLGFLPGDDASEALAMSAGGEIVVGLSYSLTQRKARPFIWTEAAGMAELPAPPGSALSIPVAVSDLGTVAGTAYQGSDVSFRSIVATASQAVVWSQGAVHVVAGCAGTFAASVALSDNETLLGTCQTGAFVAPAAGAARLLALPPPPAGYTNADQSIALAGISADGNVILGARNLTSLGGTESDLVVWNGATGQVERLAPRLIGNPGGVVLTNPTRMTLPRNAAVAFGAADGPAGWLLQLP